MGVHHAGAADAEGYVTGQRGAQLAGGGLWPLGNQRIDDRLRVLVRLLGDGQYVRLLRAYRRAVR